MLIVAGAFSCGKKKDPIVILQIPELSSPEEPFGNKGNGTVITVYVYGEVKKPGQYSLPRGSLAIRALEEAGGPGPGADLSTMRLFREISPGEMIFIPSR